MKMTRVAIVTAVLIMALPTVGQCFGFFNVTDARIEHLEGNTYRFRASFDWGGDPLTDDVTGLTASQPNLYWFFMTPVEPMDAIYGTATQNPTDYGGYGILGEWFGGRGSGTPFDAMLHGAIGGSEFGWDFNYDGPCPEEWTFNYRAIMEWQAWEYPSDEKPAGAIFQYQEEYTGSFTATLGCEAIPEPTTLALFGFGLLAAGVTRRFRR